MIPLLSIALAAAGVTPPPRLIVFGGGWGAEGTQASIEANVEALAKVLSPQHPKILFAAGERKTRSVQIPDNERDETAEILGMIFDRRDNLNVSYRASEAPSDGAASKANVLAAIDAAKDELGGTIVFGVGHGSSETEDVRASLELWGPDDRLKVDELAHRLDGSKRKGAIALVLGECHSGAFADIAHAGADPKAKIVDPVRCVLAAVPKERQASGCTADVDDPHARAYVALIAEALSKKEADFDQNGRVSLSEAHAYARIYDDTVDVPVSTSELWMKRTLGHRAAKAENVRLERIVDKARPELRAVLLKLNPFPTDPGAVKNAARQLAELDKRSDRLDDEIDAAQKKYDRLRREVLDQLLLQFPELANPYHRDSRRLLARDAPEVMDILRPKSELKELVSIDDGIADREEERLDLDRQAARLERWLDAIEEAENETLVRRSRRDVETLDRLIACESMNPL
jgi:hypothetical protein